MQIIEGRSPVISVTHGIKKQKGFGLANILYKQERKIKSFKQ